MNVAPWNFFERKIIKESTQFTICFSFESRANLIRYFLYIILVIIMLSYYEEI